MKCTTFQPISYGSWSCIFATLALLVCVCQHGYLGETNKTDSGFISCVCSNKINHDICSLSGPVVYAVVAGHLQEGTARTACVHWCRTPFLFHNPSICKAIYGCMRCPPGLHINSDQSLCPSRTVQEM